MKRSELKIIIKECVKEILFEEGVLSNLVAEVAMGITKAQGLVIESKNKEAKSAQLRASEEEEVRRKKLLETKKKMLNAMGNSNMKNVFEGTEPLRSSGENTSNPHGPLANIDPSDSGVDISGLFNLAGKKWTALNEGMKK